MSGLRYIFVSAVVIMACITLLSTYSPIQTIMPTASSHISVYGQMREGVKEFKTLNNDTRPHTKLIILTYMRSGSTLTGSFFAHHPDVFYLFEPFHSLGRLQPSNDAALLYFDMASRKMPTLTALHDEMQRATEAFLDCRFLELDLATLSYGIYEASADTLPFYRCRGDRGVVAVLKCLMRLFLKCKNTNMTVLKTIRMPMKIVGRLMREDPHLKVIHLIRDPRATLKSRWQFMSRQERGRIEDFSKHFCDRINDDLVSTKILKESYPDRVMSLLYENLATRPYEVVKQMYDFAELDFTSDTEDFIKSVTQSNTDSTCGLCVKRYNSSKTSEEWREDIDYDFAKAIDEQCTNVYTKLKYTPVENNEHLRNLSMSLHS